MHWQGVSGSTLQKQSGNNRGIGWGVRDGGGIRTCGDVVEGDAGAGEGVLYVVGDAVGVPVGGDGDGAGVAGGGEGGAHVLRDEVGVAVAGDMAVLDVPPHRGLHRRVLPHSPRRRQPRFRRRSGRVGVFLWFATAAAAASRWPASKVFVLV